MLELHFAQATAVVGYQLVQHVLYDVICVGFLTCSAQDVVNDSFAISLHPTHEVFPRFRIRIRAENQFQQPVIWYVAQVLHQERTQFYISAQVWEPPILCLFEGLKHHALSLSKSPMQLAVSVKSGFTHPTQGSIGLQTLSKAKTIHLQHSLEKLSPTKSRRGKGFTRISITAQTNGLHKFLHRTDKNIGADDLVPRERPISPVLISVRDCNRQIRFNQCASGE